jgi:hypothetical protein
MLTMANKTWLWLEKRLLRLIKISTFLSRFLLEISNLRKCGQQKLLPSKSPDQIARNNTWDCITTCIDLRLHVVGAVLDFFKTILRPNMEIDPCGLQILQRQGRYAQFGND